MLVRTSKNAACFSTLNISFWREFSVDVISSCMPMTVRYKITYPRKYRVHVVYGMVTLVRFLVLCCEGVCGIKETSISVWGTLIYRLFTVFSVAASFSEATPVRLPDWPRWRWPSRCQHVSGMTNYPIRPHRIQLDHVGPHLTSCERSYSTEDVICLCEITHHQNLLKLHIALMALFPWSRPDNQLRPTNTVQEFPFHLSTRLRPVFYHLHCTVFIRSYWSLFGTRLSRYTSAYSLVVRYCSESSRHHYRKMKMLFSNSSNGCMQAECTTQAKWQLVC